MTDYERIEELWGQATKKVVAPVGFKGECEEYIYNVMINDFKTSRFVVFDDIYDTGITSIEIYDDLEHKLKFIYEYEGKVDYKFAEYMEDEDLYNISRTMDSLRARCYEEKETVIRDGKRIPRRTLECGLVVEALMDDKKKDYLDDNGVYHIDMTAFYVDEDAQFIEFLADDFDFMKDIFLGNKCNLVKDDVKRAVAEEYLLKRFSDKHEIKRPLDNKLFEVMPPDGVGDYEQVGLEYIYRTYNDNAKYGFNDIYFHFENGREEMLEEIDLSNLWEILYAFEYKRNPHYKDIDELGKELMVDVPENYIEDAEHYISHMLYKVLKTSRWGLYCGQSMMLMDKSLKPIGYLYDVACKHYGEELSVIYTTCEDFEKAYHDGNLQRTIKFSELSAISMKHIVDFFAYWFHEIENGEGKFAYFDVQGYEEFNDICGVRVPYRMCKGEMVTFNSTLEDDDMRELARRKGIKKQIANSEFYGNPNELDLEMTEDIEY